MTSPPRLRSTIVCIAWALALGACSGDAADGEADAADAAVGEIAETGDAAVGSDAHPESAGVDTEPDVADAGEVAETGSDVPPSDAAAAGDSAAAADTASEDAAPDDVDVEPDVQAFEESGTEPVTIDPETDTTAIGPPGPCGTPVAIVGSGLRRHPYVQSVFTTSARVAWTDTEAPSGSVRYAAVGSHRWRRVAAETRRFETDETGDEVVYTAFDATLVGLEPDIDVCYEVYGDGDLIVARGALHTSWEGDDRPLRMIVVGDTGNDSPEQHAIRDRMMEVEADLFLHLGDMAYGDGRYPEFERHMFAVYAELLQAIPMWPTVGNHEYKTGLATPYIAVYYLPENAWRAEEAEYYYSFDYGNAHFVSLDSNEFRYVTTIGPREDNMIDWLRADLAASDAEWKIAFMHHPIYSSGQHGSTPWLQAVLVPEFEAGGVDLVLVGHDHHYERTVPILGDAIARDDAAALTYIVAGAGGVGLREVAGDWFTEVADDQVHNFLYLEIDGCTATGRAIGIAGQEVDAFTLDGCD